MCRDAEIVNHLQADSGDGGYTSTSLSIMRADGHFVDWATQSSEFNSYRNGLDFETLADDGSRTKSLSRVEAICYRVCIRILVIFASSILCVGRMDAFLGW